MTEKDRTLIFIKYRYQIELGILCLLMTFISTVLNRGTIQGMFMFWIFMVGVIIVPGTALLSVFPVNASTRLESLLFSQIMGYIISMLVYSVTVLLKLDAYLKLIYVGIALISFVILWSIRKQKDNFGEINKREEKTWMLLILILFFVSLIIFSLKNALPTFFEQNLWHNDLLWWEGDIASLTHSIPPVNFRTLNTSYSYHYFGALQVAAIAKTTGVPVAELAIQYSYIEAMIILGLSSLCLTIRVIKKNAVFTLFLLLFSTGLEKLTGVTFFWHIYQVPMSFNIAISLEMVIILLLLIQLEKEKLDFIILSYLLICLFVCTGTKGPSGAIVLCGIGMTCLYWLAAEKNMKKAFGYGVLAVIIFGGIYKTLLVSGNGAYLGSSSYVDSYKITLDNTWIVNCKIFIWKLLKYFRYVVLINPFTFVPAGMYVCQAIVKKRLKFEDIIFSLMLVVGTILGYILHYYGNSEIYFTLAVFPFAAILAGKFWGKVFASLAEKQIFIKRTTIFLLIFAILFLDFKYNWKSSLQTSIKDGVGILKGISPDCDVSNRMMTNEEYEVYRWISYNTDFDAIFLSDRSLEEGFCYIPGVFSERYMYNYLENNELEKAKECFQGDIEAIKYFIDKHIKYFIQNRQISPDFYCPEEYGRKIYDNGIIVIWEMQEL